MICRLCLTDTPQSISIFSQDKIPKCITKYLHLKLSPEDPVSKVICSNCWNQLDNFDIFCFQIAEAQKSLLNTTKNNEVHNQVKEEDPAIESSGDADENAENTLILNEEIIKTELDTEQPSTPLDTNCKKTNESTVLSQRVTRQSTLSKKKITNEAVEVEKTENDEHKQEESRLMNKSCLKNKPEKSAKFLTALQTSKEFDEIIRNHMKLSCDICSVHLSDFADLKQHFRTVHKRRGYAVCCNKRLNKRGLFVDHINVHKNPEYFKCNECGKVLSDRICLNKHILSFHQTEDRKHFKCDFCPKKFAKRYLLDQHSVKHVPQDEFTFICGECGKGFPTNSTLKAHLKQVHTTLYDRMCEICAKLIRGKAAFKRHVEEHEGIVHPQLQCAKCGSWLKDKRNLHKHMVTQHSNEDKHYSCEVCGKNAPSKGALQSHMRYVHELTRTYNCTFCEKSFKKPNHLKEHMATHTGETLYTCPHCPSTFNSRCNMYAHRKKKHKAEWEAGRALAKKDPNRLHAIQSS